MRRRPLVLVLWALGTIVVLAASLTLADPGLMMFVLDPELLALLVVSSLALLRASAAGAILSGVARASAPRLAARLPVRRWSRRSASLSSRLPEKGGGPSLSDSSCGTLEVSGR
jgi:hypothetical protein